MSNKEKRGEFIETIQTEEPGLEINVSFSDNLNDTEHILVQLGPITVHNGYACAYLTKDTAKFLIIGLQNAEALADDV